MYLIIVQFYLSLVSQLDSLMSKFGVVHGTIYEIKLDAQ